jgi:uncharacterized RDD family membrane protein YckC
LTPLGYKESMQFDPKELSELDDLTEEQLGFSALSEGLGLTRAPQQKRSLESTDMAPPKADPKRHMAFSGIGAVAAGPARPVLSAPKITMKSAATQSATNPLSEPAASRTLRSAAFLLDAAFVIMPFAAAWNFSFGADSMALLLQDLSSPAILFLTMFATYFLLSESFGGQSLGKMLLGLRVVEDDKYQKPVGFRHTAIRLVLLCLGVAAAGLGLLASFWDFKRRPWHDRWSASIVRKKS